MSKEWLLLLTWCSNIYKSQCSYYTWSDTSDCILILYNYFNTITINFD